MTGSVGGTDGEADDQYPRVRITGGPAGHQCRVEVDGEDVSHLLRAVEVICEARAINEVRLIVSSAVIELDVDGEITSEAE